MPGAISSVADDSAASVLAGVNPVHDLYASFDGPIAGGSRQHPILLALLAGLIMVVAAFAYMSGISDSSPTR